MIVNLVHYDRTEDEELPEGSIQEAVDRGEISIDQILSQIRFFVTTSLPDDGTVRLKAEQQVDAILQVARETTSITEEELPSVKDAMVEAMLTVKPAKVPK